MPKNVEAHIKLMFDLQALAWQAEITRVLLAKELSNAALDELERASAENSAWLYAMDVDPRMDPLRGAARFRRLQKRVW